ncbi:alpha/beta hydrolase family protein [Leptolyngbya sp. 7M]|uniref:alpha/beta hydrolase family protein n=1 Tax=Leptolyngbya sp. 7M TaxID=2812896 RepID=UPI001B8CF895|nr:lipase family protein [Leptolyngbya sp. 7M]QYO68387.1 hypothetical protein JVX88_17415 [Leptolyngbya sp. 7M]
MRSILRRTICGSFFIVLSTLAAFGQQLISSSINGTMTAAEVNERMAKAYGKHSPSPTNTAIELFKITYASLDAKSKRANLTGLVVLPVGGAPKGLVVYCHGTTVDRDRSPSRFTGTGEAPETIEAITGFASGGYAVVLPDYIGMGDHKAAHPYPLSKVNARSGVDIIPAARELMRQRQYNAGPQLFITGYSEGGGVAMALTQALQAMTGKEYEVTASAPAAGPYDLSGATRVSILEETGEQVGFILRIYLTSYGVNYLVKEKGMRWRDFFKPTLANALALNYNLGPSDDGLIRNIGVTTALMRANNRLDNVMQPAFLSAMRRNDAKNQFVRMLKENDVFDWSPRPPMLLIALEGDTVVTEKNTENAYNAMRRRGVPESRLQKYIFRDPELNHLNAVAPSLSKARVFFDGGFNAVR